MHLKQKTSKKLHAYQSSKKKMRSKHVQCLSHWYINYISITYLSPPIHIYFTTRLHINEGMREKTSPPHFSPRNLSIYWGFRKGGVCQTGHSTPHLTPPSSYYFHNWTLFEILTFRNQMKIKIWGEKVTCWVRCWVRCLANTSLSESHVNKGVSDEKVRWWGLFANSFFFHKKEKRDKQIKLLISLIGSGQTYLLIPYQRIRQYPWWPCSASASRGRRHRIIRPLWWQLTRNKQPIFHLRGKGYRWH